MAGSELHLLGIAACVGTDLEGRQVSAEAVNDGGSVGVGVSVGPDDRVNEVCQHGHEPFSLRARADDPAPAWGHTPTAYL